MEAGTGSDLDVALRVEDGRERLKAAVIRRAETASQAQGDWN